MTTSEHDRIDRRLLVAAILADRPDDLLVVSSLGSPTYDVAAAGDHPLNFPLWGAMGSAVTVALGLALARPANRVLAFVGDGELLMALGALATIGVQKPANLAVALLDNASYGETGGQPSHTGLGVDIPAVARGCGFAEVRAFAAPLDAAAARAFLMGARGPVLASFAIDAGERARVMPPRDGHHLRVRFCEALHGAGAARPTVSA